MRGWNKLVWIALLGCGSNPPSGPDVWPDPPETLPDADRGPQLTDPDAGDARPCVGLECRQVDCGGGASTTLTGVVTAPNGTTPVYGAYVYVPNVPMPDIADGPKCSTCEAALPTSVAVAVSDTQGRFKLQNVPVGADVPLVIQTGKWRRVTKVPWVAGCTSASVPAADTRLPRNRAEGHMPRIAVTTGCDALACTLHKIGIDTAEMGVDPKGPERVTIVHGASGAGPKGARGLDALFASTTGWDRVLLASECDTNVGDKLAYAQALQTFADQGGRVLATGSASLWPRELVLPWKTVAAWSATPASDPSFVDVTFPLGKALGDWLDAIGQTKTKYQLTLGRTTSDVGAVDLKVATRYAYAQPGGTQMLSFRTPVGKQLGSQCGAVDYAAFEGAPAPGDVVDDAFPAHCGSALSQSEHLLAFMLLRQTGCAGECGCPPPPPHD